MDNNNQINKATEAVILARVSSKEQEDGKSLDAQIAICQDYAQRNHLKVLQTYRLVESSTKGDRKEFSGMLNFIRQQKRPVAVIAHTVDRFQRRYNETVAVEPLIRAGSLELHFVNSGLILDQYNYEDKAILWDVNVMGARAYINQIRVNTRRGMNKKLEDGEWPGLAPLGYKNISDPLNKNKKTVVIDETEAPAIKKLFEWYAAGGNSIYTIAEKLKNMGFRTNKGLPYNPNPLWACLQNPFYYGVMKRGGKLYPHKHGALVSKSLWEACQAVRLGYKKQHVNYGSKDFIFRGQVHCSECGKMVSPYTKVKILKNGKKLTFNYLSCSHKKLNASGQKCQCKQINEKSALETVIEALEKITIPEYIAQHLLAQLNGQLNQDRIFKQQQKEQIMQRLTNITTERNNLFSMSATGVIGQDYLQQRLQNLKTEEEQLKAQQQECISHEAEALFSLKKVLGLLSHIGDIFRKGSRNETKRAILKLVFSNLLLKDKNLVFTYRKPFQLLLEGSKCCVWGG